MTAVPATAAYAIDPDGRIAWTDDGFAELARDYGRPMLADGHLVGRPLTDFVAGERPRTLQRELIERAQSADGPLELRYRCDAPGLRRHAILRLDPQPDGGVVFTTWFDTVEERPYRSLLDHDRPRGEGEMRLCAWCNRVDLDGWREVDDAEATEHPPRVAHTVCEVCELLLTTRPAGGPRWSGPYGPA